MKYTRPDRDSRMAVAMSCTSVLLSFRAFKQVSRHERQEEEMDLMQAAATVRNGVPGRSPRAIAKESRENHKCRGVYGDIVENSLVSCDLSRVGRDGGARTAVWVLCHEGVLVADQSLRVELERFSHELGDSVRRVSTARKSVEHERHTPRQRLRQSCFPKGEPQSSSAFG